MDIRLLPAAAVTWFAAWWLTRPLEIPGLVIWLIALLAGAGLLLIRLAGREPSWRQVNRPEAVCAHLALMISGILAITLSVQNYQHRAAEFLQSTYGISEISITGKVISEPKKAPFGDSYFWTLADTNRNIQIQVTSSKVPYRAVVQLSGTLQTIEPNQKQISKFKAKTVQILKPPPIWWRATNNLRKDLMEVTSGLSPQGRGLVPGMAIGDTSRVSKELNADFKVSGLSHLTAVSGGHFAIILMALSYLTGGLRLNRWLRVSLFTIVAVGFVMLVRPDPAVIRAAAMCAVSILATIRGRQGASIAALSASVLVLLALDPWLSRSYGFALSCSASGSLALFATPLSKRLTPWLGEKLAYLVAVPMVAQAGCTPVLLLFTNGIATTTVMANLLVGPAVAPATLLSLAATILAPLAPGLATHLAQVAAWATGWIAWVATRCAGLPHSLIPVNSGPIGALTMASGTGILGLVAWRWQPRGWPENWRRHLRDQHKRIRLRTKASLRRHELGIPSRSDNRLVIAAFGISLAVLFALSAGATKMLTRHTGAVPADWLVAACDVGQGDSTVIRTGSHSAIVIDTGNDDGEAGQCLKQLGVTRIDLLVLSHFHSDHVGGLHSVLAGRSVTAAIGPGGCGGEAAKVYGDLAAAGVEMQTAASGAMGVIGEVSWQALGQSPPDAYQTSCPKQNQPNTSESELNDLSLVFLAQVNTGDELINLVMLGDLETKGQTDLLGELRQTGIEQNRSINPNQSLNKISIIKVAHHGSAKQSPALARYLAPDVAIFSVGAQNTYGHPTAKALNLYQEAGAAIVRTDQCGTAVFTKQAGDLMLTCLGS